MRLIAAIVVFASLQAFAQVGGDWINSGALRVRVNADGQVAVLNSAPASEMTPGSNNHLFKFVNLWISGYDVDNQLHITTVNGYTNKTDYSPGPIDSLTYAGADPLAWNKVWTVSSAQISEHRKNFKTLNYIPVDAIKNWPASSPGRFYKYLAPFIDYDQNGVYEPEKGDYPDVIGNNACYFILNDNYSEHKASGGQPLKAEIYGMLYNFAEQPEVIYAKYYLVNRTDKDLFNIRVSLHSAFELGNDQDNYCGTLVDRNATFAYNGDANDENHFGTNNPLALVMVLNKNLSSSIYITHDTASETGMPSEPAEHRNFMEGKWRSSKAVVFGNDGLGSGTESRFVYPGNTDPAFNMQSWKEAGTPGERSLLSNISYPALPARGYIELDFALAGMEKSSGDPYAFLQTKADQIKNTWAGNTLNNGKKLMTKEYTLKNPVLAQEILWESWFEDFEKIELFNSLGECTAVCEPKVEKGLITSGKGFYHLRFKSGNQVITKKIIIL